MKKIILFVALGLLTSCSSTQNKSLSIPVEHNEPDYVVKERNPDPAPDWMKDWSKWKLDNDRPESLFFLGESGDVNDRISGCDLAALSAKKKIAQQVAELITNKIASNRQGRLAIDPTDSNDPGMKRAFEDQVASKSIAFLSGVKEYGKFWELRDYSRSNGHKRVFNCSTVVVISEQSMRAAIRRGSQNAQEVVEDADAKAAVKESLQDVDKNFKAYQPKSN